MQIPEPPLLKKKKVIEGLEKDRMYAVDALIMHIMKSHRVLEYQELIIQCFEPSTPMFEVRFKLYLFKQFHTKAT